MTTLTLIGKPDCHLCDVALEVVETVVAELPEDAVVIDEVSILDDPALYELMVMPRLEPDGYLNLQSIQTDLNWYVERDLVKVHRAEVGE